MSNPDDFDLDNLGIARRGSRPPALRDYGLAVVRELTSADLPDLREPAVNPPTSGIQQIRAQHHNIARLVVQGHPDVEVSLLTGYTPEYVRKLKGDPSFAELVAYYQAQKEIKFADMLERMRELGLSAMEEIQARLANEPEEWSNRELMELLDRMGPRSGPMPFGQSPAAGNVSVTVQFVKPNVAGDSAKVINQEPEREMDYE
jgi:hypothetical protein